MFEDLGFIGQITVKSSMALLLAAQGELLAERSGVLNLGVEGMMAFGALCGFAATAATGSLWIGVAGGMAAGASLAMVHAFFSITLRQNQVLSGLALTILGVGLANFFGRAFLAVKAASFKPLPVPFLHDLPLVGQIFFQQSAPAYAAYVCVALIWLLMRHPSLGTGIRAVGHNAAAADAAGISVRRTRFACTIGGGVLAGMAGAYLSLVYTPGWKESMTNGQGWMAIAIVIFASWRPLRVFWGALLFGFLNALHFYFQATGSDIVPSYILWILPYVLTILVLTLVNGCTFLRAGNAPANLGVPFSREK